MAYTNPIQLFPATILSILLLAPPALSLASASPQPSAAAGGCSVEVVAISPCLPYISSPPNNISLSPSSDCCGVVSSAFETGVADCICYLVRQPRILGFPVNSTRLFSLSSICPLTNGAGSSTNASIESLCSGSPSLPPLPPLEGIEGPDNSPPPSMSSSPPDSGDTSAATPPDSVHSSPATPNPSTIIPSSPPNPDTSSSASKLRNDCGYWFPLIGTVVFLVPIFTSLHCHTHR